MSGKRLAYPKATAQTPGSPRTRTSAEAKKLASRSLDAGYLKDAEKYLRVAHENDPVDFNVMLKLGWTYNLLKNDAQALTGSDWHGSATTRTSRGKLTRRIVISESHRAREDKRMDAPLYSSRWNDLFTYAQVKTGSRPSRIPIKLYVSTRFSADTRGKLVDPKISPTPLGLSESAAIPALGASWQPWRGGRCGERLAGPSVICIRRIVGPIIVEACLRSRIWSRSRF